MGGIIYKAGFVTAFIIIFILIIPVISYSLNKNQPWLPATQISTDFSGTASIDEGGNGIVDHTDAKIDEILGNGNTTSKGLAVGNLITISLSVTGSLILPSKSIISDYIAPNSINSTHIKDGEVNTADIADNAVTTGKIANNAVTTAKIKDGEVKTADIADNAVTTGKIANNAVTTAKIKDGEVKTADIADIAVTTGKIANNAITRSKLAQDGCSSGQIIFWKDSTSGWTCHNNDFDTSNELQTLSKSGSTISLSHGGGSVTLSDDSPSNELQTLSQVLSRGNDASNKNIVGVNTLKTKSLCIGTTCKSSWPSFTDTDTRCDTSGTCNQLYIGNTKIYKTSASGFGTIVVAPNFYGSNAIGAPKVCIGSDCRSSWPSSTDTRCDTSGTCSQLYIGSTKIYKTSASGFGTIVVAPNFYGSNAIGAPKVCIGSDCRSSWPSSSSFDWGSLCRWQTKEALGSFTLSCYRNEFVVDTFCSDEKNEPDCTVTYGWGGRIYSTGTNYKHRAGILCCRNP